MAFWHCSLSRSIIRLFLLQTITIFHGRPRPISRLVKALRHKAYLPSVTESVILH